MPRKPRIEYPHAFYHVFNRGNRRWKIFWTDEDYARFEELLLKCAGWSGVHVYAWCLMPNHFHLLLETPDGNLSQFMRRLLTAYARSFNRVHKLVGHLFQGRYRALVCDKESYLLELVRYIHLNPVRVKKQPLAATPEGWRWSSHRHYLSGERPEGVRWELDQVLARFGEGQAAQAKYREFVDDGLRKGQSMPSVAADSRFLGNEKFIERVKREVGEPVRVRPREFKIVRSVEELSGLACEAFGLKEDELRAVGKDRRLSRMRQALVYVGRQYYRLSAARLGEWLERDITAVSQMVKRMGTEAENREEVQRLLAGLRS